LKVVYFKVISLPFVLGGGVSPDILYWVSFSVFLLHFEWKFKEFLRFLQSLSHLTYGIKLWRHDFRGQLDVHLFIRNAVVDKVNESDFTHSMAKLLDEGFEVICVLDFLKRPQYFGTINDWNFGIMFLHGRNLVGDATVLFKTRSDTNLLPKGIGYAQSVACYFNEGSHAPHYY